VNDFTYQKKDSIGYYRIEDYFKVYGTKQIQDYKADAAFLDEMKTMLSGNFISKNWDEVKNEIDNLGLEVEIGVPLYLRSFNEKPNSFSLLMLTKYAIENGETYTLAMSISGILIKERVIWMAYYLGYENKETLSIVEEKSTHIVDMIIAGNE
jgi:hypothetical protein